MTGRGPVTSKQLSACLPKVLAADVLLVTHEHQDHVLAFSACAHLFTDGKFQVAITIKNSFACDLINVTATDEIIRKAGNVTFKIVEDDPRNDPKKETMKPAIRSSLALAAASVA